MKTSDGLHLLPYVLIALSFIGIADTFYLAINAYSGTAPNCGILAGCEIVLASPYSKFFGVPLSYIGMVYYLYMLALAIVLSMEPESWALRFAALMYTGVGILLSLGFEAVQVFIIGAICIYCAISAVTTLLLFIAALWHDRAVRRDTIVINL